MWRNRLIQNHFTKEGRRYFSTPNVSCPHVFTIAASSTTINAPNHSPTAVDVRAKPSACVLHQECELCGFKKNLMENHLTGVSLFGNAQTPPPLFGYPSTAAPIEEEPPVAVSWLLAEAVRGVDPFILGASDIDRSMIHAWVLGILNRWFPSARPDSLRNPTKHTSTKNDEGENAENTVRRRVKVNEYEPDWPRLFQSRRQFHFPFPVGSIPEIVRFFASIAKRLEMNRLLQSLCQQTITKYSTASASNSAVKYSDEQRHALVQTALRAVKMCAAVYGAAYEQRFFDNPAFVALIRTRWDIYQASFETNVGAAARILGGEHPNAAVAVIHPDCLRRRCDVAGKTTTSPVSVPIQLRKTSVGSDRSSLEDPICIRRAHWTNLPWGSSYLLTVDEGAEEIHLSFRGTFSDAGIVMDLHNEPFPLLSEAEATALGVGANERAFTSPLGFATTLKAGFSASIQRLDDAVLGVMREYPTYPLVVSGHSLGAAQAALFVLMRLTVGHWVSSLLSFSNVGNLEKIAREKGTVDTMLSEEIEALTANSPIPLSKNELGGFATSLCYHELSDRIQVIALAPPPCLCSPWQTFAEAKLFRRCRLTSFVFETDLVPRLQVSSLQAMVESVNGHTAPLAFRLAPFLRFPLSADPHEWDWHDPLHSATSPFHAIHRRPVMRFIRRLIRRRQHVLAEFSRDPERCIAHASGTMSTGDEKNIETFSRSRCLSAQNLYTLPGQTILLGSSSQGSVTSSHGNEEVAGGGLSGASTVVGVTIHSPMTEPTLLVPSTDMRCVLNHFLFRYGKAIRGLGSIYK